MEKLVIVFVNDPDPKNPKFERLLCALKERIEKIEAGMDVVSIDTVGQLTDLLTNRVGDIHKIIVVGEFTFPEQVEQTLRGNSLLDCVVPFPTTGQGTRRFFINRRKVGAFQEVKRARRLSLSQDFNELVALAFPSLI